MNAMKKPVNKKIRMGLCLAVLTFIVASCAGMRHAEKTRIMAEGIRQYQSGSYDKAIEDFSKLAESGKPSAEALLWLGKSFLGRGDGTPDIKRAIIKFKAAQDRQDSADVLEFIRDAFFQKAAEYSSSGNEYMEAVCYLAYSENFDKEDVEVLMNLARLFSNMGNLPVALNFAKRAYALDPNNEEIVDMIDEMSPI